MARYTDVTVRYDFGTTWKKKKSTNLLRTHTSTRAHRHTHTRTHTSTHAHTHTLAHTHKHSRTHTSTRAHTQALAHTHKHSRTHTSTRAHTHTSVPALLTWQNSWYFIKIKYSEPNISEAASVSPLAFAVLLLATALHYCGRPLLDWG